MKKLLILLAVSTVLTTSCQKKYECSCEIAYETTVEYSSQSQIMKGDDSPERCNAIEAELDAQENVANATCNLYTQ